MLTFIIECCIITSSVFFDKTIKGSFSTLHKEKRSMAVISSIESNPARRVDDHGEFEAWASAATASGRAATHAIGQSIDFLINGVRERTELTNDEGRTAPFTFTIPAGKTSVTLGAQIAGDPATYRPKTIVMPAVTQVPQTADKLSISISRDARGGKRIVNFSVFRQNNVGIEGLSVYITPNPHAPADQGTPPLRLVTNDHGFAGPIVIDEQEETMTYYVSIPETFLRIETFIVVRRSRYPLPQRLAQEEKRQISDDIRGDLSWNPIRNVRVAFIKANAVFRNKHSR